MARGENRVKFSRSFCPKSMDTAIETGIIITGTTVCRLECSSSRFLQTAPHLQTTIVEGDCLIFIIPEFWK
jgi:hypothetical protein